MLLWADSSLVSEHCSDNEIWSVWGGMHAELNHWESPPDTASFSGRIYSIHVMVVWTVLILVHIYMWFPMWGTIIRTVVLLVNWLRLGERVRHTGEVQVLGRDWKWSWFCLHCQRPFGPIFIQSRSAVDAFLPFRAVLCMDSCPTCSLWLWTL